MAKFNQEQKSGFGISKWEICQLRQEAGLMEDVADFLD